MIHNPWRRARASSAFSVSMSAVQPVGLAGVLTKMTFVRGVTAASTRATSQYQPLAPSVSGTGTGCVPAIAAAPAKFGQAGSR